MVRNLPGKTKSWVYAHHDKSVTAVTEPLKIIIGKGVSKSEFHNSEMKEIIDSLCQESKFLPWKKFTVYGATYNQKGAIMGYRTDVVKK
jgi:hypothetical protein